MTVPDFRPAWEKAVALQRAIVGKLWIGDNLCGLTVKRERKWWETRGSGCHSCEAVKITVYIIRQYFACFDTGIRDVSTL